MRGVGRILARLKHHGIDSNTLVIFLSDNGAPIKLTMDDLSMKIKGGAWDGSKNTPDCRTRKETSRSHFSTTTFSSPPCPKASIRNATRSTISG